MSVFQTLFRLLHRPKCRVCKRPLSADELKRGELCKRCAAKEHARTTSETTKK